MPVRRLPETLQNRIAAGEVVERPASVVKELVENAIDAGARRVAVELEAGGAALIRVTDDGAGMVPADLALSVERHATSKLPDDRLDDIRTLGFRGEALPSIGAVARLAIATRHASGAHGWELAVEGGRVGAIRPAALGGGTRVEVRDLFFATPARLKFLKSERSEAAAVAEVVERLALAAPQVHFALRLGERAERCFAGGADEGGARARLAAVLGAEAVADGLAVSARREGFAVEGLVGRPAAGRGTGRDQYLVVNGRPVRDRLLLGALRAAYGDLLPRDRFPVAALFFRVDPAGVDVNVHPAKTEVRFRDAGHVRALLISAVREALARDVAGAAATVSLGARTVALAAGGGGGRAVPFGRSGGAHPLPARPGFAEAAQAAFEAFAPSAPAAGSQAPEPAHPLGAARAQLHATYIVAESADGLVVVDQHAAHERLVYERLKRAVETEGVPRQMLLIPEVVPLDGRRTEALLAEASSLERWGLVVEGFGIGAVLVREAPAMLGETDLQGLVRDLADAAAAWEPSTGLEARLWAVASRMACHGSVRAGRVLKPAEMNALLREMEQTPNASICNHGRPTYVKLGLGDVERLFGRR